MRYCGRDFLPEELEWIRRTCRETVGITRKELSVLFCREAGWRKPDGSLKDMSCRVAMLRMDRDGLIRLPAPQGRHYKPRRCVARTLFGEPKADIEKSAGAFDLSLEIVDRRGSPLWNELIDRYHYLGYRPLPGAQIRYFVKEGADILALLGFSASAWATAARDRYIGWDPDTRKRNLHLVVNNSRYLLLPWVRSKHLASRILALAVRRLAGDWHARYRYQPVLVETFVEQERFTGTCYKAAGWTCVGLTRGRGKLDRKHEYSLPAKTVWVRPLERGFREKLLGENA